MDAEDVQMEQVDTEPSSNLQEIVLKWKEKFRRDELKSYDLEEYWHTWVLKHFAPVPEQNCFNTNFDEEVIQKVLFQSLEEFICDGDPSIVLRELGATDKPPSVCGKVFRMGEPTYSCRECGMDNTCVLCVDCFKNSEHRFHKYKMGTSVGGGCCDCGDTEAWKKSPFCTIHLAGTLDQSVEKIPPQNLLDRSHFVFETILCFAYNKLNNEDLNIGFDNEQDEMYDVFCTVLYNDEVHTFEQVILTLKKIMGCVQKTAIEYVTSIDREGRAVVKCSNFKVCQDLQLEIRKYTSRHGSKPLKVLITHASVIAHQNFAIRLLSWLQSFIGHSAAFRTIFSEIVQKTPTKGSCILKGILLSDTSLWKSARSAWHHLLISGMLIEYENKKQLAKIFTKNYGQVMKDFIKDDHDHSYSISSLSVQLYTVPTLAHHLIANDDVLYILMNTLLSEYTPKCNKLGKLEFERNPPNQAFKRAQYMLYDLRYLLGTVPEAWTDDLRRSFLHGMSLLLNLMTMMQGMDPMTRQVGQHLEYEPEWESAFNLHIKLASSISMILSWCAADKIVLVKMYRATLKKLEENPCYDPTEAGEVRELCDHSTACLHYDVSSKPVSIHQPLSRFLAGLHLHLEDYGLHFDSNEFQVVKPTPVQIIEPVLRTQVMIAQVHAGMWRRNGYSLLNQLYFYHNVKCRTEMLDRDVTVLQIGASLIESNEFLIHFLNKFGLIDWALPNFEPNSLKNEEDKGAQSQDTMRQTINLVEEFLQLIIVIVGERYMPGISDVTTEDRIKKEIIQYLCVKPLTHSELNKAVADDISHNTAIDDVIDELADFIKPSQSSAKGVYKLKPEFYKEYNVFYYHYTKEDLSKSEEAQRKRRKDAGELECCPPPKLPKLNESFTLIVNVLHCDVMLHIIQTVLTRCLNLRARSFSEIQVHKVLHLIGYGLQEEESKNYPFFKFVENATKFNIPTLTEELLSCGRVDAHKDLVRWILNKFKQLSNPQDDPVASVSNVENEAAIREAEKARRSKLAAERRAKIMAQMTAMQKNFMKENAKLFEETHTERSLKDMTLMMETTETETLTTALGSAQSTRAFIDRAYTCILCQEEEKVSIRGRTLVFAAFVHQATVLCFHRNCELLDVSKHDPLYLHSNLGPAPHTSTCGHVMHSECWRKYFENVLVKEHRRPYRPRHPTSFDVDKQEFLCPLCESLSNTVLPLLPSLSILQPSLESTEITFDEWFTNINIILKNKVKVCHGVFKCSEETCKNAHCKACINASNGTSIDPPETMNDCEANCTLQPHQVFYSCPVNLLSPGESELSDIFKELFIKAAPPLNPTLSDMIQFFAQITYTKGLNVNPHPTDKRIAPMVWKSLSYTIHALEILLRNSKKSLLGHLSSRQRDCVESLVRIAAVFGCTQLRSVILNSHCLTLLSILLENSDEGPSILQWDSFGFLVPLTFALPSLVNKDMPTPVPTGGELECHTLRLIFICHIVRILLMMNVNEFCEEDSMEVDSSANVDNEEDNIGSDELIAVLNVMNKAKDKLNIKNVWSKAQECSLSFLRCCVLFYHFLTDVPAPSYLLEVGGETFSNMCGYLGLPNTPKELFSSRFIMDLIEKWCSHEEIVSYLNGVNLLVVPEPLPINQLVELPDDYSELINTVSMFACPSNEQEDCRNPTMCLVCGEILCSQSYCCQVELNKVVVGATNYHASRCGAGVGIFLRVRECEVLLLASPHKGCLLPPPYLDDYGETDMGLRRGNPLKLCRDKYKDLHSIWLGHSIHENIARFIESTNSQLIPTQWHHF